MIARRTITEAEAEAMADRRVMARLAHDRGYRHACNAEEQAEAEERIGEEVWRDLRQDYVIEGESS